jgi:hypothetical protein
MISIRVLSTAAAIGLAVAMAAPTASFAQGRGTPRGGVHAGGGGGAVHMGGGGQHFGGGGGGWHGGYGGGYRRGGGGGFIPGAVAGAIIGGAIASAPYGYYGGPGYYAEPGYYGDQYDDDAPVAVAPAPGGDDAVAYCVQTYRSYDPRSGTYVGFDGYRHPCP